MRTITLIAASTVFMVASPVVVSEDRARGQPDFSPHLQRSSRLVCRCQHLRGFAQTIPPVRTTQTTHQELVAVKEFVGIDDARRCCGVLAEYPNRRLGIHELMPVSASTSP